jgi:pimeloyl-ACP methyl ester carboxylesterase
MQADSIGAILKHKPGQEAPPLVRSLPQLEPALLFYEFVWMTTVMLTAPKSLEPALHAPVRALATRAGGTISYYSTEGGSDAASRCPLLLLHSVNAAPSAMEVKPLFEHYASTRRVVAPDLPGFGLSDREDIEYSPTLYAEALIELVDSVADQPVDAVALSTTAEFAALAAIMAPEKFASLTLISPTGLSKRRQPAPETKEKIHRVLRRPRFGRGLYRLLTVRRSIRFFLNKAFTGKAPEEMVDYACATTRQPGAQYAPFYFLSGKLFTAKAWEVLYAKLQVRTLILYDRDPNVGFDNLDALLARNPLICSHRITPTLGLPHWEKPAETQAALDQFWNGSHLQET